MSTNHVIITSNIIKIGLLMQCCWLSIQSFITLWEVIIALYWDTAHACRFYVWLLLTLLYHIYQMTVILYICD